MKLTKLGNNETQITTKDGTRILVSYETPVAAFVPGEGYVRTATKWSRTTTKHINTWLAGSVAVEKPQEYFLTLMGAGE